MSPDVQAPLLPVAVDDPRQRPPARVPMGRRGPRTRRGSTLLVLAAIVTLGVLGVRHLPARVAVRAVVRGTAVDAVYATGSVEAVERATVKARAAGDVVDLRVREGARVRRGDVLAVIDARVQEAELARARAESWAAAQQAAASSPRRAALKAQGEALRTDLGAARTDRLRFSELAAAGSASAAAVEQATARESVLEARLAANAAELRALAVEAAARDRGASAAARAMAARLSDTEVRAPIDGVVLRREIEAGDSIVASQPLFRIGDVDRLIVEALVDEADVARVAPGQRAGVSLYAFPGRSFEGKVTEVLPDADRLRKSFLVKVRMDHPPSGLRSGMTAEVDVIVQERPDALLAPAEAVDPAGNVWVVADGHASRRALRRGIQGGAAVEVSGEIAAGTSVVVGGGDRLVEGQRVRATPAPAAASRPEGSP